MLELFQQLPKWVAASPFGMVIFGVLYLRQLTFGYAIKQGEQKQITLDSLADHLDREIARLTQERDDAQRNCREEERKRIECEEQRLDDRRRYLEEIELLLHRRRGGG